MKKIILGTFSSRPGAETLIHHLRSSLNVPQDDISCIYRNAEGQVYEFVPEDETDVPELAPEVKMGSLVGGTIGAVIGAVLLIGAVPVLGSIFAANTIVMIVGMSVSAFGMMAVGGLIGSVIGGVIASLIERVLTSDEEESSTAAQKNDVLVVAHARDERQVGRAFTFYGANGVEVYTPTLS
jgi:hypothetical protein